VGDFSSHVFVFLRRRGRAAQARVTGHGDPRLPLLASHRLPPLHLPCRRRLLLGLGQ
jgi:hypothetical protein